MRRRPSHASWKCAPPNLAGRAASRRPAHFATFSNALRGKTAIGTHPANLLRPAPRVGRGDNTEHRTPLVHPPRPLGHPADPRRIGERRGALPPASGGLLVEARGWGGPGGPTLGIARPRSPGAERPRRRHVCTPDRSVGPEVKRRRTPRLPDSQTPGLSRAPQAPPLRPDLPRLTRCGLLLPSPLEPSRDPRRRIGRLPITGKASRSSERAPEAAPREAHGTRVCGKAVVSRLRQRPGPDDRPRERGRPTCPEPPRRWRVPRRRSGDRPPRACLHSGRDPLFGPMASLPFPLSHRSFTFDPSGPHLMAIRLKARAGETAEQLLRRFKKLCEKEGLTKEVKRRQYYEKPSERRRREVRRGPRRPRTEL